VRGRLNTVGFDRESRQNHRHHACLDPEYPSFRQISFLSRTVGMAPDRYSFSGLPSGLIHILPPIHNLGFFLIICIVAFVLVPSAFGQDKEQDEVVRVQTDLIAVPVRILDNRNRQIAGLEQKDFKLYVDGKPRDIAYFSPVTQKLTLMFLLDQSGSVRDVISAQRNAALDLFRHFSLDSELAVVRFDEHAMVVTPFAASADVGESAFNFNASRNHRTAIFDSAASALSQFATLHADPTTRRILVLISDGLDTVSKQKWQEVVSIANRLNVTIYTIQIGLFAPVEGRLELRGPSKGFRELATKTGGQYLLAGNRATALAPQTPPQLGPLFAEIEGELRSQMVLGFYPTEELRDSEKHTITVKLSDSRYRKARVIQARTEFMLGN
jgi:Ca-activated chloride channel family protein